METTASNCVFQQLHCRWCSPRLQSSCFSSPGGDLSQAVRLEAPTLALWGGGREGRACWAELCGNRGSSKDRKKSATGQDVWIRDARSLQLSQELSSLSQKSHRYPDVCACSRCTPESVTIFLLQILHSFRSTPLHKHELATCGCPRRLLIKMFGGFLQTGRGRHT